MPGDRGAAAPLLRATLDVAEAERTPSPRRVATAALVFR